jgi:two-component system NarL family sensor kinase
MARNGRRPQLEVGRAWSSAAVAEGERIVAWLRLPAVGLLALGGALDRDDTHAVAFVLGLAAFAAWSLALLAWVTGRNVGPRLALTATGIDVVAITVLAGLSGGAYSHARLAYFLIPVAVAFRFRPAVTAAAASAATLAYVVQALAHPAFERAGAAGFTAIHAGYLAWIGVGCVALSTLLARRTERVQHLVDDRSRLLADVLTAEEGERHRLADALHDTAIQNVLSARHELQEAAEAAAHPALARADGALEETVAQIRGAVFELHPFVLEHAGIAATIRALAQREAARGGFDIELDLVPDGVAGREQLLYSVARELLANVAQHAQAEHVAVSLQRDDGKVVFEVRDDGCGVAAEELENGPAHGHIGLATQRVRVEAAGGELRVESAPAGGTVATVRLPAGRA